MDATGLVNWQRAVKSEEELVFMRKAARISQKIMDGVFERVVPGMRKADLVAEIYADAIRGLDDAWGTTRRSCRFCRAVPTPPRRT